MIITKKIVLAIATISLLIISGCAVRVPLKANPEKDMQEAFGSNKRLPVKVGIYIDEDTKDYIYRQQKMGMTFFMEAGSYLYTISRVMALQMFDEVVYVNSLPPYNYSYRPDVEAVLTADILHCYGDAVGTVSGYITGEITFQVRAYDLAGDMVWERVESGYKKSEQMDFVATFLGGMADVSTVGYEAAFQAAVKIIQNFYTTPPDKLLPLLEARKDPSVVYGADSSKKFISFFEKGKANFAKKNYYQALFCFQQAEKFAPKDSPDVNFMMGTCYIYIGDKQQAIKYFRNSVQNSKGKEAQLAREWLEKFSRKPSVALAFRKVSVQGTTQDSFFREAIISAIQKGDVYNVSVLNESPENDSTDNKEFKKFLAQQHKIGTVAVSYLTNDYRVLPAVQEKLLGDTGQMIEMKIVAKIYSANKKQLMDTLELTDTDIIIKGDVNTAMVNLKDRLSRRLMPKMIQTGLI